MSHTTEQNRRLLTRVRRIKGQAAALEAAFESGSDCLPLLQQIAAIRGAVNGLMALVLEHHVREHMARDGMSAQARQRDADQVADILRSYLK